MGMSDECALSGYRVCRLVACSHGRLRPSARCTEGLFQWRSVVCSLCYVETVRCVLHSNVA